MAKRFVAKKKHKLKWRYLVYAILIYLSFQFTVYITNRVSLASSNEAFIRALLSDSSYHTKYEKNTQNVFYHFFKFLTQIDLKNPLSILKNSFGFDNNKESTKLVHNDNVVSGNMQAMGYIEDPNPSNVKNPLVYIYNSHQTENYSGNYLDGYNITPNVMMASYLLREKLNELGIPTIVEEGNISEFIKANNWSHADSYKASRYYIEDTMKKNPSLKLMIDLHRDALTKEASTVEINGKKYAKVLFVVGLEHKNYQKNLDLANSYNDLIKKKYPTLTRGVIQKKGADVDGIYNQDLSDKMILLEVGGQHNEIEEVLNTIEVISEIIKEKIS